jgi:hypothetical protein
MQCVPMKRFEWMEGREMNSSQSETVEKTKVVRSKLKQKKLISRSEFQMENSCGKRAQLKLNFFEAL